MAEQENGDQMDQVTELTDLVKRLSVKYTSETPVSHLKKQGQYFTIEKELLCRLLDDYKPHAKTDTTISILEPACGTGCVIAECLRWTQNKQAIPLMITGVEIEDKLAEQTAETFSEYENVQIVKSDFLVYNDQQEYDLIIGNPPYFETKLTAEQKGEYKDILCGRTNVYSLFIYRSIQMLKQGGELRFIIPRTILSGKYFSKLRRYIHDHCDIVDIVKFSKTNMFSKALQSVIILKLRKRKSNDIPTGNCILELISDVYFVKNKHLLTTHNNHTTTIQSLGCRVKTGGIVWNQHKEELESERKPETAPLVMASNLKTNCLILNDKSTAQNDQKQNGQTNTRQTTAKKQYMRVTGKNSKYLESGPCVLVNRIVGMDPPKLNVVLVRDTTIKFFVENHVNIITGPLESLETIKTSLQSPGTIKFMGELLGSTQMSQHELECILPITRNE